MTAKMAKQPNKSQSQRQKFIEAARDLGCDENEAAFDAALKKIGSAKQKTGKVALNDLDAKD